MKTNSLLRWSISLALFGGALVPALASAQTASTTTVAHPKLEARMAARALATSTAATKAIANAQAKADQEITRRIASLNDLNTRVQAMQKVTDAFKQSLSTNVQAQIAGLTALKAKIDADTDVATLKTDIKAIADSYRVYLLVLPQSRIAAAADRVVTIAGMMTTLGAKLQTRIAAAQGAGTDVTALTAALNDVTSKLTDAVAQAQKAVSTTAPLTPDNGDKTKAAANTASLKAAKGDIQTATKDLQAARKDVQTILAGLKKLPKATGSATSTAPTSAPASL